MQQKRYVKIISSYQLQPCTINLFYCMTLAIGLFGGRKQVMHIFQPKVKNASVARSLEHWHMLMVIGYVDKYPSKSPFHSHGWNPSAQARTRTSNTRPPYLQLSGCSLLPPLINSFSDNSQVSFSNKSIA